MKKYKPVLIGILTFGISYFILVLLTALQGTGALSSEGVVSSYTFISYMKSLISSILLLISTVIACTYIIVNAIKNKK